MKISARVVEETLSSHAEGLREYFQDMLAMGEYLLRLSGLRDDLMASVAGGIYLALYGSCGVFHKQVSEGSERISDIRVVVECVRKMSRFSPPPPTYDTLNLKGYYRIACNAYWIRYS